MPSGKAGYFLVSILSELLSFGEFVEGLTLLLLYLEFLDISSNSAMNAECLIKDSNGILISDIFSLL